MFLGHFGVALAAKRFAPRTSLGTLVLAAQFIDLLWPTLLLLGLERVRIEPGVTRVVPLDFVHYPISHSLLAVVGWALLFGAVYLLLRRDARGALVVALAVLSHWLLDAVAHRPDLPLYPGSAQLVGLGLWSSLGATLVVEFALFGLGLALYLRATQAADRPRRWPLWAFAAFLVGAYLASVFGDPPPDVTALAWVGQSQWLLVAWAWWIDRQRQASPAAAAAPIRPRSRT
jgi:membrane-bound metal-dependent hydrolase YbcI (DUF457 family)